MERQAIQKKVDCLASGFKETAKQCKEKTKNSKIMRMVLRFAIGFLLSQASILGGYSPFGLGYVAAMGVGKSAYFGIAGTIVGYLSVLFRANGLKYVAICILIFTANYVFHDTVLARKRWFLPAATALCTASIGIVFVLDAGATPQEFGGYFAEVALASACAFLYQCMSKQPEGRRGAVCMVLSLATLLVPASGMTMFRLVSVGRAAAMLGVMLAGQAGGAGIGCGTGVLFGLAVGLPGLSTTYCALYGGSALAAGALRKEGKLPFLAAFLGVTLIGASWLGGGIVLEFLIAALAFVPITMRLGDRLTEHTLGEEIPNDLIRERLHNAADAFRSLGEQLAHVFAKQNKPNKENIAAVFERPAEEICKRCELCRNCWEQEYITTRDALNNVSQRLRTQGELKAADFPVHFSARCLQIEAFVGAINREWIAQQCRKQYQARLQQQQRLVCRQYEDVSQTLERIASNAPTVDSHAERRLKRLLRDAGISAEVCVYRDEKNHLHLQMDSEQPEETEIVNLMEEELGVSLGTPERMRTHDGHRMRTSEREPYSAAIGVAQSRRAGAEDCGDTVRHCKLPNGMLCLMLADGMGSGCDAARESGMAVELLEQFLTAGIAPESALATINSALIFKGGDCSAFTTLDLLCVNLYTGETDLYKFGSAPSFFKRERAVKAITCESLPLGITCEGGSMLEHSRCTLRAGDAVVLVSDGVCEEAKEDWMLEAVACGSNEPRQFAEQLLRIGEEHQTEPDDRTVMVLNFGKSRE